MDQGGERRRACRQRWLQVQLTHKIRLDPNPEQAAYLARACGTARFVWNWAVGEWNRQRALGGRPNAMALKKQFNAVKYHLFPWLREIHRDAHSQPFANLAKAWESYFANLKSGKRAHPPTFKARERSRDSFYVANDRIQINNGLVRLPRIGQVPAREALRFGGRITGAVVSRTADRWFVAVQVEVSSAEFSCSRSANGVTGVDLGVKAAATLSSGEVVEGPKPLRSALRRLQIRQRRLRRKLKIAKHQGQPRPPGPCAKRLSPPPSKNRLKAAAHVARLHARIANTRLDFTHKLTTRLCRSNQAIAIEDVNVRGMMGNRRLARAVGDVAFYTFRSQLEYKCLRYGNRLIIADRWFPSSKLCSDCGVKCEGLGLGDRVWRCLNCGAHHDRDYNAALNLERLASDTALPVASRAREGGAMVGFAPAVVGKVTPVRNECGPEDPSGQEEAVAIEARSIDRSIGMYVTGTADSPTEAESPRDPLRKRKAGVAPVRPSS
jgi:putative transposase